MPQVRLDVTSAHVVFLLITYPVDSFVLMQAKITNYYRGLFWGSFVLWRGFLVEIRIGWCSKHLYKSNIGWCVNYSLIDDTFTRLLNAETTPCRCKQKELTNVFIQHIHRAETRRNITSISHLNKSTIY